MGRQYHWVNWKITYRVSNIGMQRIPWGNWSGAHLYNNLTITLDQGVDDDNDDEDEDKTGWVLYIGFLITLSILQ